MKLELVLDEVDLPWSPAPDWVARLERLVTSAGPAEAVLQVVLTDDGTLHRHNRDFREVDEPTDVLSFSYLEGHEDHRAALLGGDAEVEPFLTDPHPPGEDVVAGQLLVSVPYVLRRGNVHQDSTEAEMTFMAVHGLLHVLGFDHYDDEGLAEMQNAERELMGRWSAAEREE